MRAVMDSEPFANGFDVERALERLAIWGYVTRAQRVALLRELMANIPCEASIEMAGRKGVALLTMVNAHLHTLKVRSNGEVLAR